MSGLRGIILGFSLGSIANDGHVSLQGKELSEAASDNRKGLEG